MNNFTIQVTIAKYIYDHSNTANMDNVDIYNGWSDDYSQVIHDSAFMFHMLDIIEKMKVMDRQLLKECIDFDSNSEYFGKE